VLAAMLVDEGILTVDSAGMIHRLTMDDDDVIGALGSAPVAGESTVASTGDRLIVTTARGISVIDSAGEVIATSDRGAPATTGPAPASTVPLRPGCLPPHDSTSGDLQLLDLRDGESLAEATAVEADVLTSADGCIAVATESESPGEGGVAISTDGVSPLASDDAEAVALSPDGDTIVVDRGGRLVAEPLAGDGADGDDTDTDDTDTDAGEDTDDEDDDDLGTATPHVFFADL
jgi:hypothetical protein